jgi:hypothetical protein
VAIPTDFKGPTPAANTTKSFKVFGSATVGVWALDIDGTLSAVSKRIDLGPNLAIFTGQAYTDAEIIPLVKDWLARMGALHDGAGGQAVETTKQVLVTATTCT